MVQNTTTLWRPVGPAELALIEATQMTAFPPRLPEQPIFYPVLNEGYAIKIARDWNVPASGAGFVTRFQVQTQFLQAYAVQQVGGVDHVEYWIPADDLDSFNQAITGPIEVTHRFPE
ncbi:MAG: ADP-ribosylation/crystallin J1 [Planktomarina sp.]